MTKNKKIECIMLIDDDSTTNFLNKVILENSHVAESIKTFEDPEKAFKYLKTNLLPDIILLDINMPKLNGWEFIAMLENEEIPHFENVRLFVLTASQNPDEEEKAKNIEMISGILHKPLNASYLSKINT